MNYYAAPMEGLTDRVWRQAHQKWFGPAGAADRYYAPFLSPPENRVLIKKKMAELAPAANPGAPVIPQLLAKDGKLAAWMIGELRKLTKGNTEGASFSTKTSGLRLPVTAGRVKRYKENMAEITGPKGAHVISIYDGKVVDVKRNRITNKYDVYVAHGEYITSYANMGTICVEKGQKVARNAQIGTIGSAVNVMTMETEYKLVFGIYPPNPGQKMRAEECFRK